MKKSKIDSIYMKIGDLGKKYGADKILLFGSRARGDNREKSDIDIAVFGMPQKNQIKFGLEIDDLNTLLDFDIVFITERTAPKLLENINRDGVSLMDKYNEKYSKLIDACQRLKQAVDECGGNPSELERDGIIQRFEICAELAWKTMREKLIEEEYSETLNSPKSVMRQAFAADYIMDDEDWIALLTDRNLTSHLYDEKTAQEIFERIKEKYIGMFQALIEKLHD